jgi:hypothetical protein
MAKILGFLLGDSMFAFAQKALYIAIVSMFYGIMISSYVFIIGALITTYNLTSEVMTMISSYSANASSSSSSSDTLGVFFQVLSCTGVIDAFNATKLMFFSSISFLFLRFLYFHTLSALLLFHRVMTPLITR